MISSQDDSPFLSITRSWNFRKMVSPGKLTVVKGTSLLMAVEAVNFGLDLYRRI